ncbi:3-methyladenine DNA glycosylase [Streptomyces sp. XY431]|nr:3-methyladenine DNA glycosylase [Streptomyces sp. XY431]
MVGGRRRRCTAVSGTSTGGRAPRTAPADVPGPGSPDAGAVRHWRPGFPLDVARTLLPLRRGPADPSYRRTADGALWRASRTPGGIGTLRVLPRPSEGVVEATAWGPGAQWLLDGLPGLLGAQDDPAGLVLPAGPLREAQRGAAGVRLTRTGLVLESLVPAILEQKVTTGEAYRAWHTLLRAFGTPAPGPSEGLWVAPSAREWSLVPSWEWHRAGVDPKRSATVQRAVRLAPRLEEASAMGHEESFARLTAVPGVGIWTAAETLQRCNGDADAVSVGDFHLPNTVGWALAGRVRSDDADMLALLEPYRPHRHRLCRILLSTGTHAPRFGPRLTPNDHRRR